MIRPSKRQRALAFLLAALTIVASCLGDPTGPSVRSGALALAPRFGNAMALAIVDVSAVRVQLNRPGIAAIVVDTVFAFPTDTDTVELALDVPLERSSEQFELRLAMTNALGDTVFRAGPILVTAVSGRNGEPAEPEFIYVGTGSNAAGVRFIDPPAAVPFGATVTLEAEAFDGQSNAIAGTPIGFDLVNRADTVRARITNPRTGTFVAGTQRGNVQVRAMLASGQSALHTIAVQPVANGMTRVSGNNQVGTAGQPLALPLVARVVAADALGVEGTIVEWAVVVGSDTVATATDTSDTNGDVSYALTLSESAEEHEVYARIQGNAAAFVIFSATAEAAVPAGLSFMVDPSNTLAAQVIAPAVQVAVLDAQGNVNTAATDVVTLGLLDSDGEGIPGLNGTTSVAAVAGIATFSDLSVNGQRVGYMLRASSASLAPDTSATFNVSAGPAVTLLITEQPPGGVVTAAPFFVEVVAEDAGGNRIGIAGAVTIALGANPGGATLGGTLTRTMVEDVVQFDDLTLDALGAGYTLVVSTAGLTSATTDPFSVTEPPEVNSWVNAAGGNWSTPANWSRGTVPSATDTVWIKLPGSYTVVVDVPTTVGRLEIGAASGLQIVDVTSTLTLADSVLVATTGRLNLLSGAIDGAGSALVEGHFGWSGGTLDGLGTIRVTGSMAITGVAPRSFLNRTIELSGLGLWSSNHTINSGSGATWRVLPGGNVDIQGDATWIHNQGGAAPVFDVQGNVLRTNSAGTVVLPGFSVSGTLAVMNGSLETRGVGTSSGTVDALVGATLVFASGATQVFSAGSNVGGEGIIRMLGGSTVTAQGSWNVQGTTELDGGVFNHDGPVGSTAALDLFGGRIGGTGTFIVNDLMTWTGGDVNGGGGTIRVDVSATLGISSAAARSLNAHTLSLLGSGTWSDAHTMNSGIGGVFHVSPSGVLEIDGNPQWIYNQGGTQSVFDIEGTVMKTSAGSVSIPGLTVSGTFAVQAGTVVANNVGVSSGSLQVAEDAMLQFASGTQNLSAGSLVVGAGHVQVSAGTVTVGGTWSITGITQLTGGIFAFNGTGSTGTLLVDGGSRRGTGLLTVTDLGNWSAGSFDTNVGTTRFEAGSSFLITGLSGRSLTAQVIEIGGMATWTGNHTINSGVGARLHVLPGATLLIDANPQMLYNQGGVRTQLQNEGTLTHSVAGTTAIHAELVSSGALNVTGGTLDLHGGGTIAGILATGTGATTRFMANTFTLAPAFTATGAGTVVLQAGTVTNAVGSTATFDRLSLSGGTLGHAGTVQVNQALAWDGGTIIQGGGTTRVMPAATLAITTDTPRGLRGASTLENAGAATWTDNGPINTGQGARLVNLADATFDWLGNGALAYNQGGDTAFFVNEGAFNRAGTGIAGIGAYVIDTVGTQFRINSGTLDASFGGRFGGTGAKYTGGDFVVSGGVVSLGAGTFWNADGGRIRVVAGSLTVDQGASAQVTDLELAGGSVSHAGTLDIGAELLWTGGSVSSTLGGPSGVTRLGESASAQISGAAAKQLNGPHTLVNLSGTITMSGAGSLNGGGGAVIDNMGTFSIQGTGGVMHSLGGTAVFRNQPGAVLEAAGATPGVMQFPITNASGTLRSQTAPLQLLGGSLETFTGTTEQLGGHTVQLAGGTFTLTGGFTFGGPVEVTGGVLDVAGETASIGGDLVVSGGHVDMTNPAGVLSVTGDANFQAGPGTMSAGVLEVGGDFIQGSPAMTFQPSGTHLTRFNGAGEQVIAFSNPGAAGNRFQNVEIVNSALTDSVMLANHAWVAGGLEVQAGRVGKVAPWRLTVLGDATVPVGAGGLGLRPFVLDVAGTLPFGTVGITPDTLVLSRIAAYSWANVPAAGVHQRFNAGTVSFDAPSAPGDVIVSAGMLSLPGGARTINGNFSTQGSGVFQSQAAGALTVNGNAVFGGGSTAGQISSGTLTVNGNFAQAAGGSAAAYAPIGLHTTFIGGNTASTISFANPLDSHFDSLVVAKAQFPRSTVTLMSDVRVNGGMTARDGSDIVGPASRLTINGGTLTTILSTASPTIQNVRAIELSAAPTQIGALVSPDTVVFNPGITAAPTFLPLQYRSIRINTGAGVTFTSDTIAADLDIANGTAAFVSSVTYRVLGNLRTRGAGALMMFSNDASMYVAGNANFAGGTTNGLLNDGILRVAGAFAQGGGDPAAFSATGNHRTIFVGGGAQSISFANPGSTTTTSHFAHFSTGNISAQGVQLQSPVHAVGQFRAEPNGPFARYWSVGADSIVAQGALADSVILDGVPLRIGAAGALNNLVEMQFVNMPTNLNQLVISRSGGAYPGQVGYLHFLTTPQGGSYAFVLRNESGTAMSMDVYGTNTPTWAGMQTPQRLYLREGAVLPTLSWNGQTLPP